jgi:hypothetical protein
VLPQWKLRVAARVRRRPPRSSYASAYTDSPGKCGPDIVHVFRSSLAEKMKAPFTVPTRRRTSPAEGVLAVAGMGGRTAEEGIWILRWVERGRKMRWREARPRDIHLFMREYLGEKLARG